jgi:MiaB/RimO family radical SAM methylthiotransferase
VRGHEYSRPAKEVVAEVRSLASRGVKEVCLLGQSVLRYGVRNKAWFEEDGTSSYTESFPRLLEALESVEGLERIRFTSAHPKGCTDELVRAFCESTKVCRHLHLPVQSGSDRILSEMGRRYTRAEYLAAVKKLRDFDPEFSLTTDVIVGYPGETKAQFKEVLSFLQKYKLPNVGFFAYSREDGTVAGRLVNQIDEPVKHIRLLKPIKSQKGIVKTFNKSFIGKELEVVIESQDPQTGYYLARSEYQAPDIDTIIYIDSLDVLKVGEFYNCKITKVKGYDLYGLIVWGG